jgi:hypothetical protein
MGGRTAAAAVGVAIAGLAGGCNTGGHSGSSRATAAPAVTPPTVVVRDDGSLPTRCSVRRTVARVAAFVDAFNRGDAERLDRAIAEREHFQWYSSNEGHGKRGRGFNADGLTSAADRGEGAPPHTDGRPALLRYLANRSRAGERMRLLQVQVTHIPPRSWFPSIVDDVAGVEYSIRLDAPDLAAFPGRNRLAGGKGGFGCSDGRLLAWSMGLDTAGGREERATRLCRLVSRVKDRAKPRILACTG